MSANHTGKEFPHGLAPLSGHRILYVSNALESDAPTRLLFAIARGAFDAGAECWFTAWSRGGTLSNVVGSSLRKSPVVLTTGWGKDVRAAYSLWTLLHHVQPHIVHVTLTRPSLFVPPIVRLAGNARILLTQNGLHEWKEGGSIPEPAVRCAFRAAAHFSDLIVGVSPSVALELRGKKICPPDKIAVIPNGVDIQRFSPEQRTHRNEVLRNLFPDEPPESIFLVGAAGNLRPIKNYQVFIRAAEELRHRNHFRFVIWGEGEERPALKRLAQHLGLGSRLVLPGWSGEMPKCLAACDCFVHPAKSEAFGLVVAEAMASGVPVIAAPVGGLLDLIEDGESGLFAPPNDPHSLALHIDYVAQRPSLRQKLGGAGRKRIQTHFSTAKMVAQYLQTYLKLLNKTI